MILFAKLEKLVSYLFGISQNYAFCIYIGNSLRYTSVQPSYGWFSRFVRQWFSRYLTPPTEIRDSVRNFKIIKPSGSTPYLRNGKHLVYGNQRGKVKLRPVIIRQWRLAERHLVNHSFNLFLFHFSFLFGL